MTEEYVNKKEVEVIIAGGKPYRIILPHNAKGRIEYHFEENLNYDIEMLCEGKRVARATMGSEVPKWVAKESIGEMIKRFRMQRGFSQTQLAELLGVSNKTVSKWEGGGGLPDIEYLVPLAEAFGVSTDVLLGR
jgi:DNA-binding XRE family transcriptional regulator